MPVTKQKVAAKIEVHLQHRMSLAQLIDWPEDAIMAGEFAEKDHDAVRAVVSRLGVADLRAFCLSWEDCEELLHQLGFFAQIRVITE
jgi:hypothetical protein